jgi:DNA-binding MarR family transcriptional regulator
MAECFAYVNYFCMRTIGRRELTMKNPEIVPTQEKQLEDVLVRLDEVGSQLFRRIASSMAECRFTIPPAQIFLLSLLDRLGPQRMSDLAALLGVTQSGCTALVDRTVYAGLVDRRRDPADRRVVWVELTDEGNQKLGEIRRMKAQLMANYLSRLDPDEIHLLATLLGRIVDVMILDQQHGAHEPAHTMI